MMIMSSHNAPINVKPEGGGGGGGGGRRGRCGAFDILRDVFFKFPTLGTKILVKIDQISPPKISAHFFVNFLIIYNMYAFQFYRIFRFLF